MASKMDVSDDVEAVRDFRVSLASVRPVQVVVDRVGVYIPQKSSKSWKSSKKDKDTNHSDEEQPQEVNSKPIFAGIDARLEPGSLTVILGASGAGKTTLLNLMSQRLRYSKAFRISGSVTYNGSIDLDNIASAYLKQEDVLHAELTVRETLTYAADLRLSDISATDRAALVEDVILELGLKDCADTRIGGKSMWGQSKAGGCSGGEKRRTSLGVQLLYNPSVLFADEPTTGLDSFSAYQIMQTLKHLASRGRTIIATLHQPRSEIWDLLDNVIVLTKGSAIYSGTKDDCLAYCSRIGYPLPQFKNAAEHLIDLASVHVKSTESEEDALKRIAGLKENWQKHQLKKRQNIGSSLSPIEQARSEEKTNSNIQTGSSPAARRRPSVWQQTCALTARTWTVTIRDRLLWMSVLLEAIAFAIICGLIFFKLDGSLAGIRSRYGVFAVCVIFRPWITSTIETYRLSIEMRVFDREREEGMVNILPFIISRRVVKAIWEDIPACLLFSVILYFMAGLRFGAGHFFIFFTIILVGHYIGLFLALFSIACARDFAIASMIHGMNQTFQALASGFVLPYSAMPVYVRWTEWICYASYSFGAQATNEFQDNFFDCPYGGPQDATCSQYTGTFILRSLGLPQDNWVARPIGGLIGFAGVYVVAAILTLWANPKTTEFGKARSDDDTVHQIPQLSMLQSELHGPLIKLEALSLDVHKKTILKDISATFGPGTLNAIIGPSGSGKSSLMATLAHDLDVSYERRGNLSFNGIMPPPEQVKTICNFVRQDDDSLLPTLTVRETLQFAAELRLPAQLSRQEKHSSAEEVLRLTQLQDCANTVIGDNERIKGISGGEKRRLSIAVQLLANPAMLLLDEPTSGLDANGAMAIIELLSTLARNGRTIILTIHQSRADMFERFGYMLLLSRGGFPVYAGPADGMLNYFASLGFNCPQTRNPTDFAIDLITIDLQDQEREATSRKVVESLISQWRDVDKHPVLLDPKLATTQVSSALEGLQTVHRGRLPFAMALPLLLRRSIIRFQRHPTLFTERLSQTIPISVFIAIFFSPLKDDQISVQTRAGLTYVWSTFYIVGALQTLAVYPDERNTFYSEYSDGLISPESFICEYTLLEIPMEILQCFISAILLDLPTGFLRPVRSASSYFTLVYLSFCLLNCGESMGIMIMSFIRHTGFVTSFVVFFVAVAPIMAGVVSAHATSFIQGLNWLSPTKYAVSAVITYAFRGLTFTCTADEQLPSGQCPIATGDQALQEFNLDVNGREFLGIMAAVVVIYRLLAYLVLKVRCVLTDRSTSRNIGRQQKSS